MMEDSDEKLLVLGEISSKIDQFVTKFIEISGDQLEWRLLKRTQQFSVGDFSLLICKYDQEKHKQVIQTLAINLLEESTNWRVPIKDCNAAVTEGKVNIRFDHTAMFREGAKEVLSSDVGYGKCALEELRYVMLNCHEVFDHEADGVSLDLIRSLLLAQHTKRLLEANGFNTIVNCRSDMKQQTTATLEYYQLGSILEDTPLKEIKTDTLFDQLKSSRHRLSEKDSRLAGRLNRNRDTAMQTLYFDLHAFLEEDRSNTGLLGYCPSLHIAEASCDCSRMRELSMLDCHRREFAGQRSIEECIHIVCADNEFSQQQLDLLWRLAPDYPNSLKQTHLVHGVVTSRGGQGLFLPNAEEHFRTKRDFTQEATVHKYGDAALGEAWSKLIDALTVASIKFEMLSKTCRGDVKLNVKTGESVIVSSEKMGSFVLYNFARLCTLFEHFQEKVDQGVYSPLPSVEDIDFSLLREEEEWMLFYNYVLAYPSLVRSTVSDHLASNGHAAKIHTHKVCSFLSYLSKDFSSYYNRVHVLVESRRHLLPQMFARLYLLKTIQLVMSNGLALLDIEPLRQM